MFVLRSVKNGKTDTQTFSIGEFNTSSTTATATRNGTTHNHSLGRGSPVVGSRGVLSRSLRLTVAQRRSPSSRRTMIIDRTNSQIKPSVSSTNLATPDPRGSASKSGASSGKMIQPRTPIGAAASAQIPRILAREYCSLCLSLGGPCTVDSLSLGPRFSLMEGCSPLPEPYFLVRLHYMASLQWCKPHQVHSLFTQVPRRCVLGSSVVLTAFSTMGAGASVGSVGEGGETP